jgi:NAD(P)-dependent dehydrogenase (short-subunit alcohol dehydrogenase family)
MTSRGPLFVIGAGPGVGAAVARRFGQEGHAVGLVARNEQRLSSARRELREHGVVAEYGLADVRELFARALAVTVDDSFSDEPDETLEILLATLEAKLRGLPETTIILMRSMLTHPEASDAARRMLDRQITLLANAITGSESRLRAALVMSSILGLTIARELLGTDDLKQASPEQVIDLLRPSLRAILNENT